MTVSHNLISEIDRVVVRPHQVFPHLVWPLPGLARPGRVLHRHTLQLLMDLLSRSSLACSVLQPFLAAALREGER